MGSSNVKHLRTYHLWLQRRESGAYQSLVQGQGCLDLHDQEKAHRMNRNSGRRKDAGVSFALARK
jgi:hypothetical protein